MKSRFGTVIILLVAALTVLAALSAGLGESLTLESLKVRQAGLSALAAEQALVVVGAYFLIHVIMTSCAVPGVAIFSLGAGAIFGLWGGVLLACAGSTVGACLAFLATRHLLRDVVRRRYGHRLAAIDRGIAGTGGFYLLTLRLNPLVPFFLINMGMALTAMRLSVFAPLSLLGMLPPTFVYASAGTQLARIESIEDILSPQLFGSLLLLSLLPLISKFWADRLRRQSHA